MTCFKLHPEFHPHSPRGCARRCRPYSHQSNGRDFSIVATPTAQVAAHGNHAPPPGYAPGFTLKLPKPSTSGMVPRIFRLRLLLSLDMQYCVAYCYWPCCSFPQIHTTSKPQQEMQCGSITTNSDPSRAHSSTLFQQIVSFSTTARASSCLWS